MWGHKGDLGGGRGSSGGNKALKHFQNISKFAEIFCATMLDESYGSYGEFD